MSFYFERFEHRRPPPPVPHSPGRELLWQFLVIVTLVLGANYIRWRWADSLNHDALWFAIPLALAETFAYIGLVLFAFNLWRTRDPVQQPPPRVVGECSDDIGADRPVAVDVFITTYNEEEELVRISIRDAKKLTYPHPIDLRIHVLDDGRRPTMRAVAAEEGVGYLTRSNNIGFKAGNLRNAMELTSGDFIVICDADTRVFPTLLEHTLGYFRDKDVAWVQTPQWFYDIPEGTTLPHWLGRRMGRAGAAIGRGIERVVGTVRIGHDPFVNDPQMFYDAILRRRNWCFASFCCGAGSVHRREAVMQAALRSFALNVDRAARAETRDLAEDSSKFASLDAAARTQAATEQELTPYKFHVSEDIYTSIVLHNDEGRRWKSVLHPGIESKMLSPQDLLTWMIQRFKYAGGTLDIALRDNPLLKGRMSLPQRLMYLTTFWSYLGCLWNIIFLVAPIVYLFTGIPPLAAYNAPFYWHALPFILATELAFMVGTWGMRSWDGKASYLSFFPVNFRALWTVLRGEKIKFHVTPKDRQEGSFLNLVIPQLAVIVLTLAGLLYASWRVFAQGQTHELPNLVVNVAWGLNNVFAMLPLVRAALWQPDDEEAPAPDTAQPAAAA